MWCNLTIVWAVWQGTAPVTAQTQTTTQQNQTETVTNSSNNAATTNTAQTTTTTTQSDIVISPLDEMNRQPTETVNPTTKTVKKPKVAKKNK